MWRPMRRLLARPRAAAATAAACAGAAVVVTGQKNQPCESESPADGSTLPLAYDAGAIAAYWSARPFQTLARCADVLTIAAPVIGSALWQYIWHEPGEPIDEGWVTQFGPQLRAALVELGPCAIKLGQAMSIRPDLLPPAVIYELQTLCDQVPPFATADAIKVIEEDLGGAASTFFDGLDERTAPVAAASLGQVFKVRIKGPDGETGAAVAVKVQRPDMVSEVSLDLYLLRRYSQLVEWIKARVTVQPRYDTALVDAFGAATFGELDYQMEAANQLEFREAFSDSSDVYVPSVIEQLTSRRVLVTEWIEGEKLIDSPPSTIERLTPVGIDCFLTQLLDLGFFHSDPHPGNLLVDQKGRLVLIDFGLCARVDRPATRSMTNALVHLMQGDVPALLGDAVQLGFLAADVNREKLLPVLDTVFSKAKLEARSRSQEYKSAHRRMQFRAVSQELNQIFFEFPFAVPDYFALVTRALIVLEGIALTGDHNFDMFNAAYPFALRKALKMTDAAPVTELLTQSSTFWGIISDWLYALIGHSWGYNHRHNIAEDQVRHQIIKSYH